MDTSLGQLIRSTRKPLNISMRKLAIMIGVSPGYISQIERDLCSPPTEATLTKLADALNLNRGHVMSKVGKIPRVIIEGFVAFPEEVEAAEKYFSEKLATKEGVIPLTVDPASFSLPSESSKNKDLDQESTTLVPT